MASRAGRPEPVRVLQARALAKTYGEGPSAAPVLRGLDFEVRQGEFVIILGPSGSGKSTLLNILGLMDVPSSGELLLEGRPASGMSEAEKARWRNERLGFVFQFDALLAEFTMLENILMPHLIADRRPGANVLSKGARHAGAAAHSRASALMEGLGLKGLEARFPTQVSGGERQRAALCRALVNSPAAVLADEPTGNLDKASGELVLKDLKDSARNQGAAVVLVTHNEAACRHADRVLQMRDGALEPK